jgi:hypothetical protein
MSLISYLFNTKKIKLTYSIEYNFENKMVDFYYGNSGDKLD